MDFDPTYRMMTARFNQTGAKSLLSFNLPITNNLDIILDPKINIKDMSRTVESNNLCKVDKKIYFKM